ncbi:hypothetical protein [Paenibacillus xylanexedens]|uniref:PH domain-containing protein n=1 Tax=Paenibacillus xylanexedens TaxID=528191 RepID=A0ABS4RNG5_PAEXY|nr:hypothetical protein [Paenibacillus xylanexedens]MBP2243824.1 hypothetical protein [Paenibacillus xylanexedens]
MNRQQIEDKTSEWLSALSDMKAHGVISSVQYDAQQRNVKAWWYDRKTELEEGADKHG